MILNEDLLFRLYLGRELLLGGAEGSVGPLPTDRMKAVLQLDHSTELLLLTLLPLTGERPRREDNLPTLLQRLTEAKQALASHRGAIERIRRLRDRVQHDGLIPSPEDARTAAVETESFARAAVREILQCELEELTLVSLVEDPQAVEHLLRAEDLMRGSDYEGTCKEAAVAFALGRRNILSEAFPVVRARGGGEIVRRLFREIGEAARRAVPRGHRNELSDFAQKFQSELSRRDFFIGDLFEPLEGSLLLAGLGISLRDLRRFEEVTPHVALTLGENGVHVASTEGWSPSREEAAYSLDFATRSLLLLERWIKEHPALRTREDQV